MTRILALLAASLVSVEAAGAAPILIGLGTNGSPTAVSDDGATVVGTVPAPGFNVAGFIWTASAGVAPLGGVGYRPKDVSADGSVVVGSQSAGLAQPTTAFRWTAAGGVVPFVGEDATGISADGSVIVGTLNNEAYRWTEATGAVALGFVREPTEEHPFVPASLASGVSGDGAVVVGVSGELGKDLTVYRWTEAGGMVNVIPGGPFAFEVEVSSDGSVVVAHDSTHADIYTWAASGDNPFIPGGFQTRIGGINGDGSLVVGTRQIYDVPFVSNALVWDPVNGLHLLADALVDDYGLDLGGWILNGATDISPDGRTIVGDGVNPQGQNEAWLVSLPEPGAAVLLGAAAPWLGRPRRRW